MKTLVEWYARAVVAFLVISAIVLFLSGCASLPVDAGDVKWLFTRNWAANLTIAGKPAGAPGRGAAGMPGEGFVCGGVPRIRGTPAPG